MNPQSLEGNSRGTHQGPNNNVRGKASREEWTILAPVSPSFCVLHATQLVMERENRVFGQDNFSISDSLGLKLFNITYKYLAIHRNGTLRDPSGTPIVTLKESVFSAPVKWKAYRGNGGIFSNLLFTFKLDRKTSSVNRWEVYLAGNRTDTGDFAVKSHISEKPCFEKSLTITYKGSRAAETRGRAQSETNSARIDQHKLTVEEGVDQAFIAALLYVIEVVTVKNVNDIDAIRREIEIRRRNESVSRSSSKGGFTGMSCGSYGGGGFGGGC